MKIKKEYIILAAVIVGLALYLYFRKNERALYQLPELFQVSAKDISKIEIDKADGKIVLKKAGDTWYVIPRDYPADTSRIKGITSTLEKLTLTAMVSESKNYTRYDLNPDKKISVKAWAGEELRREFDIGKDVRSSRHTFVKLAGDDRIYHAQDNFRNKFDRSAGDFRDKTVLSFTSSNVREIRITTGDQVLTFNRTQAPLEKDAAGDKDQSSLKERKIWQSADGREGDESRLNKLLSTLSNLTCEDYIEDRKKEDFTDPIYLIQLKGEKDYSLSIFAKLNNADGNYPAVSSENNYPFLLPEWKAKDVMPTSEEIIKTTEKS
ncbi:MAG: DUF4340 domain-containing protein [Deltaproteobacteria bacterium]|nr:MAG: DUF4340 domain-containing protein [Deltaproteobacteria bacterium]